MEHITWSEEYSVNIKLFDEHHQQLVKIINQLKTSIDENKTKNQLNIIFAKLIEYAQIHFDSEESLLAQNGYSELNEQKKEHHMFVDQLKELRSRFKKGDSDMDNRVLEFLKNWLIHHIMVSDMAYKDFLNGKGVY